MRYAIESGLHRFLFRRYVPSLVSDSIFWRSPGAIGPDNRSQVVRVCLCLRIRLVRRLLSDLEMTHHCAVYIWSPHSMVILWRWQWWWQVGGGAGSSSSSSSSDQTSKHCRTIGRERRRYRRTLRPSTHTQRGRARWRYHASAAGEAGRRHFEAFEATPMRPSKPWPQVLGFLLVHVANLDGATVITFSKILLSMNRLND